MTTIDRNGIYTLVRFYESLTANNIGEFHRYYAENAYFKDPFNEVHHVDEICEIFARMFRQVVDPRFVIKEKVGDGNAMFLEWEPRPRRGSVAGESA